MNGLHHDSLLFNVHDLALLMAAGQYLLLAALLFSTRRPGDKSVYLLVAILVVSAVQAVDTLLIWSEPLRRALLSWDANALFVGSFSYWLQGPLLFGYVASVLYRDYRWRWNVCLHLLPALLVGALLVRHYYSLPSEAKVAAMWDQSFLWTPLMTHFITGWHLSVIGYGAASVWLIARYRRQLLEQYANVEVSERGWLLWVVWGFMLLSGWKLSVHLVGNRIGDDWSNLLGIASHYLALIFVTSLAFVSIRYTHLFAGLTAVGGAETAAFTAEQVERVRTFMERERPYLADDISLELLARRLSLPERTLSRILNHHFKMNFFEFINRYRIEEAKRLLSNPQKSDLTIMDVLAESGFSSKSTFNTIFKKQVGQTPSQYRKAMQRDR